MDKLTFEEYCNEAAFPESVSISAYLYKDGSADSNFVRSDRKGLTRLDYFTGLAFTTLVGSSKTMGYPSIADSARTAALSMLAVMYNRADMTY